MATLERNKSVKRNTSIVRYGGFCGGRFGGLWRARVLVLSTGPGPLGVRAGVRYSFAPVGRRGPEISSAIDALSKNGCVSRVVFATTDVRARMSIETPCARVTSRHEALLDRATLQGRVVGT